jgi:hypothetical protein
MRYFVKIHLFFILYQKTNQFYQYSQFSQNRKQNQIFKPWLQRKNPRWLIDVRNCCGLCTKVSFTLPFLPAAAKKDSDKKILLPSSSS